MERGVVIVPQSLHPLARRAHCAGLPAAPDEGETVADMFYRAEPHPQAPCSVPIATSLIWLPKEAFANAFAQQASTQEQACLRRCVKSSRVGDCSGETPVEGD